MGKAKTSVADVRKLIASEEGQLAKLRARREAFAAAEEKAFAALVQQREALAAQLDELAAQLAQLQGAAAPEATPVGRPKGAKKPGPVPKRAKKAAKKARGRPRGKRQGMTLRDAVTKIMSAAGKPVRAPQVASQLKALGYKTTSKDPVNMVSALLAQTKEFRRVRKGLYTLAASAKKRTG